MDRRDARVRGLLAHEGETSGQGVAFPGEGDAEPSEVDAVGGDEVVCGLRRMVGGQVKGVEHRRSPSRGHAGAREPSILPLEGGLVASPHSGDILEMQGDEGTSP